MKLNQLHYEHLRRQAKFAGLADLEIECEYHDLKDVPAEALIHALRSRGLVVELHVFDMGPPLGLEPRSSEPARE